MCNPWNEDTPLIRTLGVSPKGVWIEGVPLYTYYHSGSYFIFLLQKRKKQRKSKKKQSKVSHEQSTRGEGQADSSIISSANELSAQIRRVSSANLSIPFLEQFCPESYQDSREAARELFKLLISPVDIDQFHKYVKNTDISCSNKSVYSW